MADALESPTSPRPSPPRRGGEGVARVPADPSDIRHGDWVERWLPRWAEPYARLARWDRPIGAWLDRFPRLATGIALSRRDFLDLGLRHDLRASGQGGRCEDRRQILGARLGRADSALPVHLLRRRARGVGIGRHQRRAWCPVLGRARRRGIATLLAGGSRECR